VDILVRTRFCECPSSDLALNYCVHPLLEQVAHRPWQLPTSPWSMRQTWHDLLFAHWPVSPAAMRTLVPAELDLDMFDGHCWVGVVPFRMSGIRRRGLPALPGFSRFPELNVRTYVTYGGKAGVYFFSLDAASSSAVWAARHFYHLPYFRAAMSCEIFEGAVHYSSRRYRANAEFRANYCPTGEIQLAARGSLEHWLTERYCLYAVHRSRVYRGEIHHQPWPLQTAQAEFHTNTVAAAAGISLPDVPPSVLFAHELKVLIWPLRPAS